MPRRADVGEEDLRVKIGSDYMNARGVSLSLFFFF